MANSTRLLPAACVFIAVAWPEWGLAEDLAQPYNPEAEPAAPAAQPYNPEAEPVAPGGDQPQVPAGGDAPQAFNPEADLPVLPGGVPGSGSGAEPRKSAKALPDIQCEGDKVCREPGTGLPVRTLARAYSKAYQSAAEDAELARERIPALIPLYVFARTDMDLSDPVAPKGWYQVSETEAGPPFGWLKAADAVEWRQALVVAYTHPGTGEEERQRVLMFEYLEDLQMLTESADRETQATAIYGLLEEGRTPAVILSKEPEKYVKIENSFYLLPIVDHLLTDIDGDEARYLRLAAAVPEARGPDTLEDPEYRAQAQQKAELDETARKALNVDIVFVMDMTRSMQPYIDNTRKAVVELADRLIAKEGLQERVRFGLIGYRDSVEKIPALEFTARNFTPELVTAEAFNALVEQDARATRIGSVDYPEEVYAGIDMALASTAWRDDAMRFLVLVGDASAHEPSHPQSTTGKDAATLRTAMEERGLNLLAMHLRDYRMSNDHPIAEAQFTALSRVAGSTSSAYTPVELGETPEYEGFKNAVADVATLMLSVYGTPSAESLPSGELPEVQKQARRAADALVKAALVEYLGRDAQPPKDILVWALDRDLTNPSMRSLEVRVLVTKTQLSSLIQALDRIMQAMKLQQEEQMKLFEALQSVASATMKDPDQIGAAQRLAETGLLPRFIEALPYRSDILSLTEDSFGSLTADQRASLEDKLTSKLQQYRDVNEQVDGWVKLNPGDPDSAKVYPLPLSYLP